MNNYEKCIKQTEKILEELRTKYPRMALHFFAKNILLYLWVSEKMLNPSRFDIYSDKKYRSLYLMLKEFGTKSFINWLLNKE